MISRSNSQNWMHILTVFEGHRRFPGNTIEEDTVRRRGAHEHRLGELTREDADVEAGD